MFEKKICDTCNHFPDCKSTEAWRAGLPCTGIGGVKWEKLNNKPTKINTTSSLKKKICKNEDCKCEYDINQVKRIFGKESPPYLLGYCSAQCYIHNLMKDRILPCELYKKGGKWLGAARSWLQSNTKNGDRVMWGSLDILEPHLTVRQMEDFAAHVAAAAINEYKDKK